MDNGEDGSDEGDDSDGEGEPGAGLLAAADAPGEDEEAGLRLKPGAGVKSMGRRRAAGPGGCWSTRTLRPRKNLQLQSAGTEPLRFTRNRFNGREAVKRTELLLVL